MNKCHENFQNKVAFTRKITNDIQNVAESASAKALLNIWIWKLRQLINKTKRTSLLKEQKTRMILELTSHQSLASSPSRTGFATPFSFTSLSFASNSQALGGTSTAGEELKNPCGCTHKYHQHYHLTRLELEVYH